MDWLVVLNMSKEEFGEEGQECMKLRLTPHSELPPILASTLLLEWPGLNQPGILSFELNLLCSYIIISISFTLIQYNSIHFSHYFELEVLQNLS